MCFSPMCQKVPGLRQNCDLPHPPARRPPISPPTPCLHMTALYVINFFCRRYQFKKAYRRMTHLNDTFELHIWMTHLNDTYEWHIIFFSLLVNLKYWVPGRYKMALSPTNVILKRNKPFPNRLLHFVNVLGVWVNVFEYARSPYHSCKSENKTVLCQKDVFSNFFNPTLARLNEPPTVCLNIAGLSSFHGYFSSFVVIVP